MYNCPDCKVREDTCNGCQRAAAANHPSNYEDLLKQLSDPIPHLKWDYNPDSTAEIPSCCVDCSNHPSNGGSGICHCALPYIGRTEQIITCTSANYML